MPRRPRRNHSPAFKSKVALAGVKGDKTISEIHRVLDTSGELVLTVLSNLSKLVLELLAFRTGVVSRTEIVDHKSCYARSTRQKFLL